VEGLLAAEQDDHRPPGVEVSTVIAFEVRLNGQLLCTAGRADISVLSAVVNYMYRQPSLFASVGGLTQGTQGPGQHLDWLSNLPLSVGDEVSIRIVDVPTCDPPKGVRSAQ
jgi:hypothetical protein